MLTSAGPSLQLFLFSAIGRGISIHVSTLFANITHLPFPPFLIARREECLIEHNPDMFKVTDDSFEWIYDSFVLREPWHTCRGTVGYRNISS